MWLTLIMLHAAAGVAAFALGATALSWRQVGQHRWIPSALTWMLIGLIGFMAGAIGSHWAELNGVNRSVFSALGILAMVMLWRAGEAERIAATAISESWTRYVDHVGFVLISLFNAFVIVAAIDLGSHPAVVVSSAIAATLGGHFAIERHKHRNAPAAEQLLEALTRHDETATAPSPN